MDKKSQAQNIGVKLGSEGILLEVEITPSNDGNKLVDIRWYRYFFILKSSFILKWLWLWLSFFSFFRILQIKTKSWTCIWRSRPIVGLFEPRDGILVIEDKKLHVNKEVCYLLLIRLKTWQILQSLASQSFYFECLFKGDFKEKNMNEIPIGEVSFEVRLFKKIKRFTPYSGACFVAHC